MYDIAKGGEIVRGRKSLGGENVGGENGGAKTWGAKTWGAKTAVTDKASECDNGMAIFITYDRLEISLLSKRRNLQNEICPP
jgi:hypothetical protein